MKRILALTIVSLLWAGDALAIDNTLLITPCASSCITTKSKDIGAGVQAPQPILSDTSGNPLSTPTAGADAVSNTATGLLGYSRNLVFNGTTWDRWTGLVSSAQSGTWNITNISGTVSLPTGASTAANQASQLTQETATAAALGTTTDAVGATPSTGSAATLISLAKAINNNVSSPIPTGTNTIGSVKTTDGTNTAIIDPCQGQVKSYTAVNVVTATNVVITGVSAKKKYICGIFLYPAGTVNIAVYQATTATSCATAQTAIFGGTTTATGFVATAQAGFVVGTGGFSMAATTTNQTDICVTTSAAVQVSGVVVTVDQ